MAYVPNMKPYSSQVFILVLISAVLICTLDADSEDSECFPGIEVQRHTMYKVSLGQELTLKCPVTFCNNKPPKVSWYKVEESLSFNISNKSHIKTEWKTLDQSKGEAYLIFKTILDDDAGVYQCQYSGNMGFGIMVNVSGHSESSSVSPTNSTTQKEGQSAQYTFWHYIYRIFGIVAFVLIVSAICGISKFLRKGEAKNSSNPSRQAFHHIYDNDL